MGGGDETFPLREDQGRPGVFPARSVYGPVGPIWGRSALRPSSATPFPSPPIRATTQDRQLPVKRATLKRRLFRELFVEVEVIGHDVVFEGVGPSAGSLLKEVVVIPTAAGEEGKEGEIFPPFFGPFGIPGESRFRGDKPG